jgi:TonB family protein
MNPMRILRSCAAVALVLAPLALLPSSLGAQATAAAWREVMRGDDGTTVSIDSASVSRTTGSSFIVRTAIRFPQPMQLESGAPVNQEIDLEEFDCDSAQIRGIESQLLNDTVVVRRVQLSHAWVAVEENRRPLFDASCRYLLSSIGASPPLGYELTEVEQQPELANRGEVSAMLSRFYPPELREVGASGIVTLRMRVLEDGTVDLPTITVVFSADPRFSGAAIRTVGRMRFRPARADGRAVKVWVSLPVAFSIQRDENGELTPTLPSDDRNTGYTPEVVRRADPRPPPLPPSRRP